jgi:lipopolysaccharide/colanic/teichoic acid biosynthesis glycosyltransferase
MNPVTYIQAIWSISFIAVIGASWAEKINRLADLRTAIDANALWFKRFADLLVATIALVIFTPFIVLTACIVWLDSPGNPFFCQVRVGKDGKPFTIFKIRTLYVHHFGVNPVEETPQAYRITRAGKYLRRSKADELPQLINVLLGDMSIVGPRPDIPIQVKDYSCFQQQRLLVKPGLTGVAQVSGNTQLCWHDRILMDIWYLGNRSFLLDLKIMVHTFTVIFSGERITSDPFSLHANLFRKN